MSAEHVGWAFRQNVGNPTRKLVLVALADRLNKDTLICRPLIKNLAEDCNLSERAARQALKDLCDTGVLKRQRRRRLDGSLSGYDFVFPDIRDPAPPAAPPAASPAAPPAAQEPEELLEPEEPLAAAPQNGHRERNEVWDALTDLFGDATTRSSQTLRGKMVKSLVGACATYDEIHARARRWPRVFPNAALTETALEKHWPLLQPARSRAPTSALPEPQQPPTAEQRDANVKAAQAGLQELRRNL